MNEVVLSMLGMQGQFLNLALEGVSDEDSKKRIDDSVNHINWIAGHIVSCRFMLAGILGLKLEEPYPELFANTKGRDDSTRYPEISEIRKGWDEVSNALNEKISSYTTKELIGNAPMGDGRLIDIINFFVYHEAYHIGQIGLLRKALGYPAISHGG